MCDQETGLFWRLACILRSARDAGDVDAIDEAMDDLALIRRHTDSEGLRRRCDDLLVGEDAARAVRI